MIRPQYKSLPYSLDACRTMIVNLRKQFDLMLIKDYIEINDYRLLPDGGTVIARHYALIKQTKTKTPSSLRTPTTPEAGETRSALDAGFFPSES